MRVKRFRNISIYDIGKMESYLSDMAKEGLFLTGMSQCYNHFRINEPADMEYRIEFGEKGLNREMRELYEQSGWSYTCTLKGVHIFQAAASDTLVEIHTDPAEQSYTLLKACKMFRRLIPLEIVLFLIMLVLSAFVTMIGGTPTINLLENNFIFIINMAFMVYLIYEIIRQLQILSRIKKRLQMGFYINHHEPWKKLPATRYMIYGIFAAMLSLCVASMICNIRTIAGMITDESNYELTLTTKLPVVRLNDIEKLGAPVIRTYFSEDNKHLLSNVRVRYNVFMKENEINEEFVQEDMTWEGAVYTPSLRTNYYKIYLPFMVQGTLLDVLYKAENYFIGMPNDKISIEKIACNGLDEVYYIPSGRNNENYFGLVIRKGNVIVWMTYCGQKTRVEVIEASQDFFNSMREFELNSRK